MPRQFAGTRQLGKFRVNARRRRDQASVREAKIDGKLPATRQNERHQQAEHWPRKSRKIALARRRLRGCWFDGCFHGHHSHQTTRERQGGDQFVFAVTYWSSIRSSSVFLTPTPAGTTPACCSASPAARMDSRCGAPILLCVSSVRSLSCLSTTSPGNLDTAMNPAFSSS